LSSGCARLPTDVERPESYALTDTSDTLLGRISDPAEAQHPQQSGFYLLDDGLDALEARLAMVDLAERSVDVQTYQWSSDLAGGMVGLRLWNAAERGVRLRVLIDDFLLDDADFDLAALDSHPNAEVRIFNPFGARIEPLPIVKLRRTFELVTDLERLNHRMHNKSFVADDQMAVVGGRNIANYYYGLGDEFNFIDFDLLLVGPQVDDISVAFDEYWNSDWAYPINAFVEHPSSAEVQSRLEEIRAGVDDPRREIGIPASVEVERQALEAFIDKLKWAHAEIVFDDPDKAHGRNPESGTDVTAMLRELGQRTTSELIIVSPYFVPGSLEGTLVERLLEAGVRVRILTNSLASTNQPAVHSGYKRYRREVIEAGIELHETQPWLPGAVRQERVPWSSGQAGLHAKVLVFDRKEVFVGTYNLDPRSRRLNTEMGLVVHDGELGAEIGELADAVLAPNASYRVELDDTGRLSWRGEEGGVAVSHSSEPHASLLRKLTVFLASLLPIEDQL
ncbi:MAG: phospholipase D-like domain-containing protein, partial [Gammaproteobacteria bacterium]